MSAFEIEEEKDILSYIVDSIDTNISYLETISCNSSKYNLYMAQLMEMRTNFESEISKLGEKLDNCTFDELQEANLEHLRKNNIFDDIENV